MASLLSYAKGIRERLAPVRATSAYLEKGVLTPEEFVEAGDQLVYKCPTWTWEAGDASKAKSYLPADKQYLATRGVPCHRRVSTLETDYLGETELEAGEGDGASDGWIEPQVLRHKDDGSAEATELELSDEHHDHAGSDLAAAMGAAQLNDDHFQTRQQKQQQQQQQSSSSSTEPAQQPDGSGSTAEEDCSSDYPDLDTYVENSVEQADAATLAPPQQQLSSTAAGSGSYLRAEEPADAILRTRSYDLSITYDKYYQVPRIWLAGKDESGSPLPPAAMFEDIMQDYARQTVTLEAHPHLEGQHLASVHPCKHAAVMRRIVENLTTAAAASASAAAGDGSAAAAAAAPVGAARVDQYLFVFLKFIQSVCPTIDYDYTMEIDAMS